MIITTAQDETNQLINKATQLSQRLNIPMVKRNKKTIKWLQEHQSKEVFVVNEKRGISYYGENGIEVFFHPNMAFHRIKQLQNNQPDSLVQACGLKEGMHILDCTLGLASDTLVALHQVGHSGQVTSLEKSLPLSIIVKEGLARYMQDQPEDVKNLLSQLQIINEDNLVYLSKQPDKSVDVVYFDFMFNHTVESSSGIKVIKPIVAYDQLTKAHVLEACRVARQRVVVKSSHKNPMLESLGFEITKKNRKRHFLYGVIEMGEDN